MGTSSTGEGNKQSPSCSGASIRADAISNRSFYNLSKAHHPDHHPGDPTASHRFARISEAYSVLGTPAKRAAYDRDVLGLHHDEHHGRHHRHGKAGSYHGTGPAGGRPASGLSRRRGSFQGPPPSFYRSGGWGTHGEKRRAAHERSTGGGGEAAREGTAAEGTGGGAGTAGGMGPGQDPFGHRDEVPHFDQEGHTKTHRREDQRRAWRARGLRPTVKPEPGLFSGFWIVTGVLGVGVAASMLLAASTGGKDARRGGART
jgi:curved DNA-binding protein CbpA